LYTLHIVVVRIIRHHGPEGEPGDMATIVTLFPTRLPAACKIYTTTP